MTLTLGASAEDLPREPLIADARAAQPYSWRGAVGLSFDLLPQRVVEAEAQQLPFAEGFFRLALPHAFSFEVRAGAVLLYNHLQMGAAWSLPVYRCAFFFGYRIGAWVGSARLQGYDADGFGLTHTPSVGFSFSVGGSRVSLRAELHLNFPQHIRFGSRSVVVNVAPVSGPSFGVMVETPVFRDDYVYYGITLNYATYDALSWLSFTDIPERSLYPSLVAGYEF
jgi:hypothetical protein